MALSGEANIWAVTTDGVLLYEDTDLRRLAVMRWTAQGNLSARPGRTPGPGLDLQVLSPTSATAQWRMTPGPVVVRSTATGLIYEMEFPFDGVGKVDTIARPSSGTSRIDRFVARVDESARKAYVERYPGTEAASPSLPGVPTGAVYEDLGTMLVPAGTAAITVTPATRRTAAAGAPVPMTTTERDAATAAGEVYDGLIILNMTTGRLETRWNGAWPSDVWTQYTPSLDQADGSPFGLVNGTVVGYFRRSGNMVSVRIEYTRGSSTNQGTAGLRFTLPVPAKSVFSNGTFYCTRNQTPGVARLQDATRVVLARGSDGALVGGSTPGSWAAGDTIGVNITYEAA